MKISCFDHARVRDTGSQDTDLEVIVEDHGFRGQAMIPIFPWGENPTTTCSRLIKAVNMAIEVLERKREEALEAQRKMLEDAWLNAMRSYQNIEFHIPKDAKIEPGAVIFPPAVDEKTDPCATTITVDKKPLYFFQGAQGYKHKEVTRTPFDSLQTPLVEEKTEKTDPSASTSILEKLFPSAKCICEITAHGKADNPECPECFPKKEPER